MRYCLAVGAFIAIVLSGRIAGAQPGPAFRADYTVEVKDTAAHLFHVTATFRNVNQPSLQLSLPIWTPGWYTLEYYGKNVRQLTVTNGAGKRLPAPLLRAQTWNVDTRGASTVVVEFDYFANVLDLNQAKITDRFAFFTGTQLFLEPVGHRDTRPSVRFVLPAGWRIATTLAETADPAVYTAAGYDDLVDSPTWLGAFSIIQFDVESKPHWIVLDSAARFPPDSIRVYTERLANLYRAASAIFGGLPYEQYGGFMLPEATGPHSSGALEHGNSSVSCCFLPTSLGVDQGYAHEFFHLWNVKRIRPTEHWPYDYSRPVDSPSLWMSEGVTDYYGSKLMYRARLETESEFLASLWQAIELQDRQPERAFVSLRDASLSTWRSYLNEPISYYRGGFITGALLDLSILRDTRGQRGMDDVMRELYARFYMKDKGFSAEDLVRTVSSVAGRDYTDFFRRYVDGVEIPPYDSILGAAGLRAADHGEVIAYLGMLSSVTPQGRRVGAVGDLPQLPARAAGLRSGDVLLAMDGIPIHNVRFAYPNGSALAFRKGANPRVVFTVLRDSVRLELPLTLRPRATPATRIERDSAATAEQLAVRRAWLVQP